MGVPYMRAVLRATRAERSSARPTAMANFPGLGLIFGVFMGWTLSGWEHHDAQRVSGHGHVELIKPRITRMGTDVPRNGLSKQLV